MQREFWCVKNFEIIKYTSKEWYGSENVQGYIVQGKEADGE